MLRLAPSLRYPSLLAAALIATTACDSPTEPPEPLDVAVRVVPHPALHVALSEGIPTLSCEVAFEARAEGKGIADWRSVGVRYYAGVDRADAIDSVEFAPSDGPFFSRSVLTAGLPDTTRWRFQADIPFAVEMSFRYRIRREASDREVRQRVDCGPVVPPGAAAPAVEIVEVRGSDPVLEAGDTLLVSYRVQAGAPLWRSHITVTGAFESEVEIYEEMAWQRERLARIVVPRHSALGVPLTIHATTADVGFRTDEIDTTSALTVVDTKPPIVTGAGAGGHQLPVGWIHQLGVSASDDNDLAWLIWELDAPIVARDSVPVGVDSLVHSGMLPMRISPEWAGLSSGVTVWARDGAGNLSAPYRIGGDPLLFYRVAPTPTLATASLGFGAGGVPVAGRDLAYDSARHRLYATMPMHQLAILDLASMTRLAPITLPEHPASLDLTLSGDSLLISHVNLTRLSVVDLHTLALLPHLPLNAIDAAQDGATIAFAASGIRVLANGHAMLKLTYPTAAGHATVDLDLANMVGRVRTEIVDGIGSAGDWWTRMAVTPDRRRVVILSSCGRWYDIDLDAFGACEAIPGFLWGERTGVDRAGARVIVGTSVLGPSLSTRQEVVGGDFTSGDLYADGEHALMLRGPSLLKVRLSDGRIVAGMYLANHARRVILLPDQVTALAITSQGLVTRVNVSGLD